MRRHVRDAGQIIAGPSQAQWIADLELGLAERWSDAILHASRRRAQADELSALPDPIGARERDAEARRMGKRAIGRVGDVDDQRARTHASRARAARGRA